MLQAELTSIELEVIRKAKAEHVSLKTTEWTRAEIIEALIFYYGEGPQDEWDRAIDIVQNSYRYEFVNWPTALDYEVTDAEKFAELNLLDIHNSENWAKVVLGFNDGRQLDLEGQFGPDDFQQYGFKLIQPK